MCGEIVGAVIPITVMATIIYGTTHGHMVTTIHILMAMVTVVTIMGITMVMLTDIGMVTITVLTIVLTIITIVTRRKILTTGHAMQPHQTDIEAVMCLLLLEITLKERMR